MPTSIMITLFMQLEGTWLARWGQAVLRSSVQLRPRCHVVEVDHCHYTLDSPLRYSLIAILGHLTSKAKPGEAHR